MNDCLKKRGTHSLTLLFRDAPLQKLFLSFLLFFSSTYAFSQTTISGEVTSADSVLSGVTVQLRGTKATTQTDERGQYHIQAARGGILVFSHVGFATQEVKVGEHSVLNIRLASGSQELNGVVVIGYGTEAKKDLTGSVASVTDEMVKDRPIASLNEGLVGQVPGVDVSLSDATPGGEIDVKIRGIGSIGAGVEPLYVIDGFPTSQAFANALDPSTILSLDVLKDASSTAIYGSRGSNGVVMITTKSGRNKEPSITFNTLTGMANVARRDYYQTLNGPDYVEFTKESIEQSVGLRRPGTIGFRSEFGSGGGRTTRADHTRQYCYLERYQHRLAGAGVPARNGAELRHDSYRRIAHRAIPVLRWLL